MYSREFSSKPSFDAKHSFLVDEIFTGKFKQYKIVDDKYELSESIRNQKESDTVTQQSKEQPDTTDTTCLI